MRHVGAHLRLVVEVEAEQSQCLEHGFARRALDDRLDLGVIHLSAHGMTGSLNRPSAPPLSIPPISAATSRLAAPASAAQLVLSGLSGRSAASSSDTRSMLVIRCGSGSVNVCPALSRSGFCWAVSIVTHASQQGAETTLLVALAIASAYSKSGKASLLSRPTRSSTP